MITNESWEKLIDIRQLSIGEQYFTSCLGDVALMDFDGEILGNDQQFWDLTEGIPNDLYFMEFEWPEAHD